MLLKILDCTHQIFYNLNIFSKFCIKICIDIWVVNFLDLPQNTLKHPVPHLAILTQSQHIVPWFHCLKLQGTHSQHPICPTCQASIAYICSSTLILRILKPRFPLVAIWSTHTTLVINDSFINGQRIDI